MRLVYHPIPPNGLASPFGDALREVIELDAPLALACPYLDVAYLREMARCASAWRLVTDVEEWLASMGTSAPMVAEFARMHAAHIRDCRKLHAKVAIGPHRALLGSANFTKPGLEERMEMGILLEDELLLAELRGWFDGLWGAAEPVDVEAASRLAEHIATKDAPREHAARAERPKLGDAGPKIRAPATFGRASLERSAPVSNPADPEQERRLIERLRKLAVDRAAAEAHLDLLRVAVDVADLGDSDPRLVVYLPKAPKIAVNIGLRYVAHWYLKRGSLVHGFIVGPEVAQDLLHKWDGVDFDASSFADGARFVRLPWQPGDNLPVAFIESWKRMIRETVEGAPWSIRRKHHNSAAYRAIVDAAYREKILIGIFGS